MSVKSQTASDIQFESKIVWLSNIDAIPYVREYFNTCCSRRKGKVKYQTYQIIGYAELEDKAPNTGRNGCFAGANILACSRMIAFKTALPCNHVKSRHCFKYRNMLYATGEIYPVAVWRESKQLVNVLL